MATRFYFDNAAFSTITPAVASVWDYSISNFRRCKLEIARDDHGIMETISLDGNADTADTDYCYVQAISDPIAAQTISYTQALDFQMRGSEEDARCNQVFSITVRVLSNDGTTVRGTLLALTRDGTELAIGTLTNRGWSGTGTVADVEAQQNDRIVIEVGTGGNPSTGAGGDSHDADIRIGRYPADDLPVNDSGTDDYKPWFQFANTITWPAGGVSVTPAAASAVGSVVAPTTHKGSTTVSGIVASVVGSVIAPAVILGSMAVTPGVVSVAGSVVSPTVIEGSVSVTPSIVSAAGSVVAPSVVLGSTTATPAVVTVAGSVVAPSVAYGSVAITPSVVSAAGSVIAPTVVEGSGSVTATPSVVAAAGSVVAPTVAYGSTTATPAVISAAGSVIAPTVVHGSVSITPSVVSAAGSVVAPTVVEGSGSISVTPSVVSAAGSVVAPTVVLGSTAATPTVITAAGSVVAPTVIHGSLSLTPGVASAAGSVIAPTVIHGSIAVTPAVVSAVGSVVDPTVAIGGAGSASITITFDTNKPGTTWIIYGTDPDNLDESNTHDTELTLEHSATLTELLWGTQYYFKPRSRSVNLWWGTTPGKYTFTTETSEGAGDGSATQPY